MRVKENKSFNFSKKSRLKRNIRYLIIHYTGMQSARVSMDRLKNPQSNVSCHYFIMRNGDIFKMVDENRVAWHAGKSKWKSIKNLNNCSIGIEMQNKGHLLGYQNFPKNQIFSLVKLIKKLVKKYKIKNSNILGHSDIAPLRKLDPGEKFPWSFLSSKGLAIWYPKFKLNNSKMNKDLKRQIFFKNIYKIGYRYFSLKKKSKKDELVIMAFQRKYLPHQISGIIDKKTLKISYFLANS